jgi:hypothetical protein
VRETKSAGESLNSYVLAAVDREVRRRQALHAHEQIIAVREQIEAATGRQVGTASMVRELREGSGRRD